MSRDRFRRDEKGTDDKARCTREQFKGYGSPPRKPKRPDEQDAVMVVDLLFGGRVKFVKDHGDFYLVIRLPT